jgi:cell division protein FtsI (penicillin-binding protein 3)
VGGKTGTVHKVGPQGYIDDQYVALFAGIAPIDNPRVVTVVVINDPKGDAYGGGSAAAPVFSSVTRGTLRLLNVPPTETEGVAGANPAAPGGPA